MPLNVKLGIITSLLTALLFFPLKQWVQHQSAWFALSNASTVILDQFHQSLFDAKTVINNVHLLQDTCSEAWTEAINRYTFETPSIRWIGQFRGDSVECASSNLHFEFEEFTQHRLDDKYLFASAIHDGNSSDLFFGIFHNSGLLLADINPFHAGRYEDIACMSCLSYRIEIDGEPEFSYNSRAVQDDLAITYRSARINGIFDVGLEVQGTKSYLSTFHMQSVYIAGAVCFFFTILSWYVIVKVMSYRNSFERVVRQAISQREFAPFYQPIVDSTTNEVLGMEVLVRWVTRNNKTIPPSQFINFVEQNGQILPITEQLIEKVAEDINRFCWASRHYFWSLNIVPAQLYDNNFTDKLKSVCTHYAISPSIFSVEVTERQKINNLPLANSIVETLTSLGVDIKLDDAGTGYGGFSYLQELGITTLKIDKMFVDTIEHPDDVKRLVLDAIIEFAKNSKLDVIAEGVETKTQIEYLKCRGVTKIQGYVFAKPMSAHDLEKWIEKCGGCLS
jgi:EAL domain-containing protein (putative c-di-GMP-specific phosphodiesterase class I)